MKEAVKVKDKEVYTKEAEDAWRNAVWEIWRCRMADAESMAKAALVLSIASVVISLGTCLWLILR